MNWELVLNCVLIVLARIADVSLGTLRTVAVIWGRRYLAWVLGFFEVLIWVLVVGRVIGLAQQEPVYAIFYAAGFATGNFIGITIERALAFGDQVVRIFTRRGSEMSDALRAEDYGVTEFDGRGRDGPVMQLFIQTRRKRVPELIRRARAIDPSCYYVVDDVRTAGTATVGSQSPSNWRGVMLRR
ncbi:MAG: DUF5698 domain-containing protein [Planctomycetota bacterium]|nr:DUF5698 domain-containing protein [Planctomycetota bacterium]